MRYAVLFLIDADISWEMFYNQTLADMPHTKHSIMKNIVDRSGTSRMLHVVFETDMSQDSVERNYGELKDNCRLGLRTPGIELLFPDARLWNKSWNKVVLS